MEIKDKTHSPQSQSLLPSLSYPPPPSTHYSRKAYDMMISMKYKRRGLRASAQGIHVPIQPKPIDFKRSGLGFMGVDFMPSPDKSPPTQHELKVKHSLCSFLISLSSYKFEKKNNFLKVLLLVAI